MLAFLGNEAELAGVLGHELGHITARHGVRQHAKQQVSALSQQYLVQFWATDSLWILLI